MFEQGIETLRQKQPGTMAQYDALFGAGTQPGGGGSITGPSFSDQVSGGDYSNYSNYNPTTGQYSGQITDGGDIGDYVMDDGSINWSATGNADYGTVGGVGVTNPEGAYGSGATGGYEYTGPSEPSDGGDLSGSVGGDGSVDFGGNDYGTVDVGGGYNVGVENPDGAYNTGFAEAPSTNGSSGGGGNDFLSDFSIGDLTPNFGSVIGGIAGGPIGGFVGGGLYDDWMDTGLTPDQVPIEDLSHLINPPTPAPAPSPAPAYDPYFDQVIPEPPAPYPMPAPIYDPIFDLISELVNTDSGGGTSVGDLGGTDTSVDDAYSEISGGYDDPSESSGSSGGGGGGGGGSYIATASTQALGEDGLSVFNNWRDYMASWHPTFTSSFGRYRVTAPKIVSAIDSKDNSKEIYRDIWDNHLKPIYDLIVKDKDDTKALAKYKVMVKDLAKKFLKEKA
jgi:hypothetical protein